MNVEAGALERLNVSGVAKLIASNSSRYNEDVDLFLVTERIMGKDLRQVRADRDLPLQEAARLLIRVLQTLHDCHGLGVIHRDIKPEHVILRDGALEAPILIDFGLAFGDELGPNDHSTATDQGVGNRFIILPEQWGDSAAKRDPISDITQVVGILFFLLFDKSPGSLAHGQNLKPHERFDWRSQLSTFEKWQLDQLALIFNTGFELDPAQRWPSAERLIAELEVLTLDSPPPPKSRPVEERIQQLRSQANNSTNQLLARLEMLGSEVWGAVTQTTDQISIEFSQYLSLVRAGAGILDAPERRYRFHLALQSRYKGTQQTIAYILQLRDSEVVVSRQFIEHGYMQLRGQNPPSNTLLLSVPVFDPRAAEDIRAVIENDVQELVEAALSHAQAN